MKGRGSQVSIWEKVLQAERSKRTDPKAGAHSVCLRNSRVTVWLKPVGNEERRRDGKTQEKGGLRRSYGDVFSHGKNFAFHLSEMESHRRLLSRGMA